MRVRFLDGRAAALIPEAQFVFAVERGPHRSVKRCSWHATPLPWTQYLAAAFGAVVIAVAVYDGTSDAALTLYRTDFNGNADPFFGKIKAQPGIGLYAAGVGGLLIVAGAVRLSRRRLALPAASEAAVPVDPPASRLADLKTLTELRDAGALTTEEFETEKARILR